MSDLGILGSDELSLGGLLRGIGLIEELKIIFGLGRMNLMEVE